MLFPTRPRCPRIRRRVWASAGIRGWGRGPASPRSTVRDQAARVLPAALAFATMASYSSGVQGVLICRLRCRVWLFLRDAGGVGLSPPSPPVGPSSAAIVASFAAVLRGLLLRPPLLIEAGAGT